MQRLIRKILDFIKNPMSGFGFYLACVSIFLLVPPKGFVVVLFMFILPFVLLLVIGLNLPFFSTLFRRFTMSVDKKRNHALEHGTIYFLKRRFGKKLRVGGIAEKDGFRICGVSNKYDIVKAFDKFKGEFSKRDPELFVSLRCGSNIVTSQGFGIILLSISTLTLKLVDPPVLITSSVLVANVVLYFLLRNTLGKLLQETLFMSTDFSSANIHSINRVKKRIYLEIEPVYFVRTIIE